MRILHTGDWHLGASTGGVSRTPDFELFFDWLVETIHQREVDVLVVAGDVFEHAQPSAEALALYYGILARLVGSRLQAILIVGGNHDAASRLDAPRELLSRLAIHVVGGLPAATPDAHDAAIARALVRVKDVVFALVPYVHEYRLGVRQSASDADAKTVRASLGDAFRTLYRRLADLARERFPDAALVATGHLVAEGAKVGDWGAHIHQVGLVGALPADIFDARFAYVALGHLHRSFAVTADPPTHYCGSPIALTLEEAKTPRVVMLADVQPGLPAHARPLPVPTFRELLFVAGSPESLIAALPTVRSVASLPPLVFAQAHVDGFVPGLEKGLVAALEAGRHGARLVRCEQRAPLPDGHDEVPVPRVAARLAELSPEVVFMKLAEARGEPIDAPLLEAFRGIAQ